MKIDVLKSRHERREAGKKRSLHSSQTGTRPELLKKTGHEKVTHDYSDVFGWKKRS